MGPRALFQVPPRINTITGPTLKFCKISTLDKTHNCGLAKSLRQRLRRNNIDIKKIKCVYSEEVTSSSGILDNQNPNERRILGSLPTITAIFGLVIANEVIKEITKQ